MRINIFVDLFYSCEYVVETFQATSPLEVLFYFLLLRALLSSNHFLEM